MSACDACAGYICRWLETPATHLGLAGTILPTVFVDVALGLVMRGAPPYNLQIAKVA